MIIFDLSLPLYSISMQFFFLFTLIFSSFFCLGQYAIRGTVRDTKAHDPIPGASVYIPDLKKGTLTDAEGKFNLDNLPRGRFLLQFKFLGYGTAVKLIDVGRDVDVDIALNSSAVELSEIVISGISHTTELKKNPIPIATLDREWLNKNASINMIENIAHEPGVYQVSTGVAISKPIIRGLGSNRIITIYDGVRQEGQQWGDEHGIEIDEFSVDRAEIIKGAGSLLYGSDGLGGVINFLSSNPVPEGSIETRLISNFQSNNGMFANSIMNTGNEKGFNWLGRASHKSANTYRNDYDGYVFNSGFNETNFGLSAGLNKSWGSSQLSFSSFNQKVGLVEGVRDDQGKFLRSININGSAEEVPLSDDESKTSPISIPNQNIEHQKLSSTTSLYYRETKLQINLGYQKNVRKEYGDVLTPDVPDLFFDLKTASYNVTIFLPAFRKWDISFSTSGMKQQNKNRGLEFTIPAYTMLDGGAVLFAKRNFNSLDIAGGLRMDYRKISTDALYLDEANLPTPDESQNQKFNAGQTAFQNYSASAGLTYQFSEFIALKFNTSRGFRAPNISELTSNGIHEGSLRYEYGNFALKPETSLQADVGFLYSSPHISAEVSLFQNRISHYIYIQKLLAKDGNDSIPETDNPFPAYTYTQGRARLSGGEFSIDLHPHPLDWLHFENALSLVYANNRSEYSDSTKFLPLTPAPRLQSEIRTNASKWKNFSNIFLKIQCEHLWKQDRVLLENGTETPTPSYTLWNAGFGFDFTRKKEIILFSFYFTAENLFDISYQNNLSRLKYADENPLTGRMGVFNMGRNLSFKLLVPVVYRKKPLKG